MRTSYQIEFLETMYVSYASENADWKLEELYRNAPWVEINTARYASPFRMSF